MRLWSEVTGRKGRYEEISWDGVVGAAQDRAFGEELADMFAYSSNPGYDGGDGSLLKAADLRKLR